MFFKKIRTSVSVGMDGCAPIRVTQMAAAAEANFKASFHPCPLLNSAANAPQNVSPAPVVSTVSTIKAGICKYI